jgi:anti-sigma B factor antagonist
LTHTDPVDASVHKLDMSSSIDAEGRRVLVLSGDIDLKTVPALSAEIIGMASPRETVVLDLAEVRFVDSPGLGSIIHCHQRLTDMGGALVLRSPTAAVQELFTLVQLGSLLPIEPA